MVWYLLVLLFVALWFILRGDLFMSCVVLFCSCVFISVFLASRLPLLGKRELIFVLFVGLFDLRLFACVCFLFLSVSGKGCGLWLWQSLDFSLTFFDTYLTWPLACWINLNVTPTSSFQTISLLDPGCWYKYWMTKNANPDQLASGSTLLANLPLFSRMRFNLVISNSKGLSEYFEISVPRHIRFAELRKNNSNNHI